MKWRAQAQYGSDAVYNRDTIFDEEVANQVGGAVCGSVGRRRTHDHSPRRRGGLFWLLDLCPL